MGSEGSSHAVAHAAGSCLVQVRLEVMPFAPVLDELAQLPAQTTLTVTCSPRHGVDHTVDFAVGLAECGHRGVVPHIAAGLVDGRRHLSEILARLRAAGIDDLFVVGGDAGGVGPYGSAGALLDDLAVDPARPAQVGIAAYPEGHPQIDDQALMSALLDKQRTATYLVSQLCFSPPAIHRWAETIREAGVELPLHVGIPGAVARRKLMEIALRVGVGGSVKFLARNATTLRGLAGGRDYDPSALIGELDAVCAAEDLGIVGAHLFTFNQVRRTQAWLEATTGATP